MKNQSRLNRAKLQSCWAALMVFCSGAFTAARAQSDHAVLVVQAKPLGAALVDFAVQANVSIATPQDGFGEARASAVRGDLSPSAALELLLDGSGFTFTQVDAVSFRIFASRGVEKAPVDSLVQDVIVTGARRPKMLDRAALAVTSTDSDNLRNTGARQTADLTFDAAGVTLTNLGTGRNKILIRGLSDGAFSGRTQSTVGVYFDDSRITYGAPDPDLQLVDIKAVEVLRGPQGALYGAGPIGGIYHIISNQPDTEQYTGSLLVGASAVRGGGVGNDEEIVLNAPLRGARGGLRFVGYRQESAGWLDNLRLQLKDTNYARRVGGRLNALVHLGDTWKVNASLVNQKIDASDSDYVDLSAPGAGRSSRLLEPHSSDFFLASVGTRGAALGGELTTTSSYTSHVQSERFDASLASAPFGNSRTRPVAFDDRDDVNLFVQEVRYAAVAAPVPWYVGGFYSDLQKRSNTKIAADPDQLSEQIGYLSARSDSVHEAAVFGNLSFSLSSQLQLSMYARYFWTSVKTSARAVGAPTDEFSGDRSESGLAPRVELSFTPSPDTFYYISAAEGYRTGGFNTGFAALLNRAAQPVREYSGDSLWSYEAGLKRVFRDGRVRTRVAAFLLNWRGVQTDQLVVAGLPFTGNVGDAKSYGIEAETTAQIVQGLQLRAHVSYTQAEVTDADSSFPSRPRSGLPGAPRLLTGGSMVYEHPLAEKVRVVFSGQARYIGQSNITYLRVRELRVGGYADVNARVAIATDSWQAAIFASNVFDSDGRTFSYGNPLRLGGRGIIAPQTPSAIGLEISRNF